MRRFCEQGIRDTALGGSSFELGGGHFVSGKSVGAGLGKRKVHFCCFCRTEVTVGSAVLHFVESVPEHLIMSLLAVQQEVDRFPHRLVVDLPLQVLLHDLGPLFRSNVAEQISA